MGLGVLAWHDIHVAFSVHWDTLVFGKIGRRKITSQCVKSIHLHLGILGHGMAVVV